MSGDDKELQVQTSDGSWVSLGAVSSLKVDPASAFTFGSIEARNEVFSIPSSLSFEGRFELEGQIPSVLLKPKINWININGKELKLLGMRRIEDDEAGNTQFKVEIELPRRFGRRNGKD